MTLNAAVSPHKSAPAADAPGARQYREPLRGYLPSVHPAIIPDPVVTGATAADGESMEP